MNDFVKLLKIIKVEKRLKKVIEKTNRDQLISDIVLIIGLFIFSVVYVLLVVFCLRGIDNGYQR